jgi:hypothetical protein
VDARGGGLLHPRLEPAFIAWNWVPLWRDIGSGATAQRLQVIAAAYGGADAHQILHAVPPLEDAVSGSLARTLTFRKTGGIHGEQPPEDDGEHEPCGR